MKNAILALLACSTLGTLAMPAHANPSATKDAARAASETTAKAQSNVDRSKGYYYYAPSCVEVDYYDYYGNLYYYYECY